MSSQPESAPAASPQSRGDQVRRWYYYDLFYLTADLAALGMLEGPSSWTFDLFLDGETDTLLVAAAARRGGKRFRGTQLKLPLRVRRERRLHLDIDWDELEKRAPGVHKEQKEYIRGTIYKRRASLLSLRRESSSAVSVVSVLDSDSEPLAKRRVSRNQKTPLSMSRRAEIAESGHDSDSDSDQGPLIRRRTASRPITLPESSPSSSTSSTDIDLSAQAHRGGGRTDRIPVSSGSLRRQETRQLGGSSAALERGAQVSVDADEKHRGVRPPGPGDNLPLSDGNADDEGPDGRGEAEESADSSDSDGPSIEPSHSHSHTIVRRPVRPRPQIFPSPRPPVRAQLPRRLAQREGHSGDPSLPFTVYTPRPAPAFQSRHSLPATPTPLPLVARPRASSPALSARPVFFSSSSSSHLGGPGPGSQPPLSGAAAHFASGAGSLAPISSTPSLHGFPPEPLLPRISELLGIRHATSSPASHAHPDNVNAYTNYGHPSPAATQQPSFPVHTNIPQQPLSHPHHYYYPNHQLQEQQQQQQHSSIPTLPPSPFPSSPYWQQQQQQYQHAAYHSYDSHHQQYHYQQQQPPPQQQQQQQ